MIFAPGTQNIYRYIDIWDVHLCIREINLTLFQVNVANYSKHTKEKLPVLKTMVFSFL